MASALRFDLKVSLLIVLIFWIQVYGLLVIVHGKRPISCLYGGLSRMSIKGGPAGLQCNSRFPVLEGSRVVLFIPSYPGPVVKKPVRWFISMFDGKACFLFGSI